MLIISCLMKFTHSDIISAADGDPGLRIESFAIIKIRGACLYKLLNYIVYRYALQTYKELFTELC